MLRGLPLTPISGNQGRRSELSVYTKGQISGLAKADFTSTQIHRDLNVPRFTIQSFLNRLVTTQTEENKPRSDRSKKLSPRDERFLLRYVRANPKTTWLQLKKDTGLDVSRNTLKRTLQAHGISH